MSSEALVVEARMGDGRRACSQCDYNSCLAGVEGAQAGQSIKVDEKTSSDGGWWRRKSELEDYFGSARNVRDGWSSQGGWAMEHKVARWRCWDEQAVMLSFGLGIRSSPSFAELFSTGFWRAETRKPKERGEYKALQ
jgi:hypothetical protein